MSECRWLIALSLSLCAWLLPLLLAAEAAQAIHCDLQACIELAFSNHPALKASDARQVAAQSQVDVRVAERKPTLELEGESGYLSGQSISPFAALSGFTQEGVRQQNVAGGYAQAILGLEVPLVKEGALVGQTSASIRQAEFKVSEEGWQNRALRLQVTSTVAVAYVDVLKRHKAVQIATEIVSAFEEAYQLALAKFQQHLISKNDLLLAEVRVATAKRMFPSLAWLCKKVNEPSPRRLGSIKHPQWKFKTFRTIGLASTSGKAAGAGPSDTSRVEGATVQSLGECRRSQSYPERAISQPIVESPIRRCRCFWRTPQRSVDGGGQGQSTDL